MSRKTKSIAVQGSCKECSAQCCRNLAMMILKPRTQTDIQEVKWYLHFDTVSVFIRNHKWYLLVEGNCIYLDDHNVCTIYDRRPWRCRRHPASDCEATGDYYDVMITTPEELENYLVKEKSKSKSKSKSKTARNR